MFTQSVPHSKEYLCKLEGGRMCVCVCVCVCVYVRERETERQRWRDRVTGNQFVNSWVFGVKLVRCYYFIYLTKGLSEEVNLY